MWGEYSKIGEKAGRISLLLASNVKCFYTWFYTSNAEDVAC